MTIEAAQIIADELNGESKEQLLAIIKSLEFKLYATESSEQVARSELCLVNNGMNQRDHYIAELRSMRDDARKRHSDILEVVRKASFCQRLKYLFGGDLELGFMGKFIVAKHYNGK